MNIFSKTKNLTLSLAAVGTGNILLNSCVSGNSGQGRRIEELLYG